LDEIIIDHTPHNTRVWHIVDHTFLSLVDVTLGGDREEEEEGRRRTQDNIHTLSGCSFGCE